MLQNTFLLIPGIGQKSEDDFWKSDILDWASLELSLNKFFTDKTKREIVRDYLSNAMKAFDEKNGSFFAEHLPQSEYWRLYKDFQDKTVFLDIETTGLSSFYDVITVIGTYDGKDTKIFIKDNNLDEVQEYLKQFEVIVTFNGKIFDVPFIQKFFPDIAILPVHIDLRFLLRTVGYSGPLKQIEKKMGIVRDLAIKDVDGREAAVLWSRFVKGDDDALKDLILYNISDTVNLKKLMDYCYLTKFEKEILPKFKKIAHQQKLFGPSTRNPLEDYQPNTDLLIPEVSIHLKGSNLEIKCNNKKLLTIQRKKIQKTEIKIDNLLNNIKTRRKTPVCVGIDLTGSEKKASGVCILKGKDAYLSLINSDEDLIAAVKKAKPDIISIDSPLSLPKGRCCVEDYCECRKFGIMRECERILKRRGINVYPCLIPSMQKLTKRGMELTKIFKANGFTVIESYPGAAQDILRFPRKRINLKELEIDLMNMGITPHCETEPITHDEIDALTSALVGYFFLANQYEAIGNEEEEFLIIPRLDTVN